MRKTVSGFISGNILANRKLTLAFRLILGITFLVFGASKLVDLDSFTSIVLNYQVLPVNLAITYSRILPGVEAIIGMALILGLGLRLSALASILVSLSLLIGTAVYLYGADNTLESCGCLLGVNWQPGPSHLLAQAAMLLMSIQVLLHRNEGLSLDAAFTKWKSAGYLPSLSVFVGITALIIWGAISAGHSGLASAIPGSDAVSSGKPVMIVIYTDFQCGACAKFNSEAEPEIRRKYLDTGQAEVQVMPLPALGEDSGLAAQAALCSADQGHYWEYQNALFKAWLDDDSTAYTLDNLLKLAGSLGLDEEVFTRALESGSKKAEVERNLELARSEGVATLPAVFINGIKIEGHQTPETYYQLIDRAIDR